MARSNWTRSGRVRFRTFKTPEFVKEIRRIDWKRRGMNSTINTPDSTGNSFDDWILEFGFWEDDKFWRDTAHWQDVSYL